MTILLSLAKFGLQNWRWVLIAVLITACGLYRHALLNEEKAHAEDNTLHQLLTAEANRKNQQAKDLSEKTVKEINDAKPKLVAEAQRNAADLYKRRYAVGGTSNSGNLGGGISIGNGAHAIGMRNPTTDNAGALQAYCSEGTKCEAASMDVGGTCDSRFLNEAAEAAVVIKLWNDFADSNGFPREK